ncbi:hypothetical protein M405DRAFT_844057 [Rhizopogon salebrosus TDB-379]|nr:hypothetical protein M405DRAFT_844057 [Rhizopogon salebrosus TDB-379]
MAVRTCIIKATNRSVVSTVIWMPGCVVLASNMDPPPKVCVGDQLIKARHRDKKQQARIVQRLGKRKGGPKGGCAKAFMLVRTGYLYPLQMTYLARREDQEKRQGPRLDLSPLDIVYQALHSERVVARLRAACSSCHIAQCAGTVRGIPRDEPKAY